MLTRAAEGPAADVHDCMPMILPEDVQSAWIGPKQTEGKEALALAHEKAITTVEHYPVARRVNNAKNQGAELIEPFENPAQDEAKATQYAARKRANTGRLSIQHFVATCSRIT